MDIGGMNMMGPSGSNPMMLTNQMMMTQQQMIMMAQQSLYQPI
jgi:hypothetical protein